MPCFYIPQIDHDTSLIEVFNPEYNHIVNVKRKRSNDIIRFTNGNGILGDGQIVDISNKRIKLKILTKKQIPNTKPKLALAFSLLKRKNSQMIVEKLTELGVKEFFPMLTERTVKKGSKNTIEKFYKTAISAIKQCDNAYLPQINKIRSFTKTIEIIKSKGYIPIYASEIQKEIFLKEIINPNCSYCILIGPEGGFSNSEFEYLDESNIDSFSISNHILRAETASIASVSQISSIYLQSNKSYY